MGLRTKSHDFLNDFLASRELLIGAKEKERGCYEWGETWGGRLGILGAGTLKGGGRREGRK